MPTTKPTFVTAYGPKTRSKLVCEDVSRTKQSMKKECDVNNIVAKYQRTGVLDFVASMPPQFGDVTGMDFRESLVKVAETEEMFAGLPSKTRDYFDNDPAKFLDFVKDPTRSVEDAVAGLKETAKTEEKQDVAKLPEVSAEPAVPAE